MQNIHIITRPTRAENAVGWAKLIGLGFVAVIAAVLLLAAAVGAYNYATMPPIGTNHTLTGNRLGHAVVVYNKRPEIGYVEKRWNAVCTQAQGGTMTLTEHLFFRKDVGLFNRLFGIYATGTYVYMPPENYPSGPRELKRWCPEGFSEAMPYHIYPAN